MRTLQLLVMLAVAGPALGRQALPEGALRRFGEATKPGWFGGGGNDGVYAVGYSPGGDRIATGHSHSAKVWDVESGAELARFPNRATVHAARFTPDGTSLAWGGFGNSFALVDLSTGRTSWEPDVGICVGFFAHFSADGRRLVSDGAGSRGHRSDALLVWDVDRRALLHSLRLPGQLRCAVLTPDGRTAISGDNRGRVTFWDLGTGRRLGAIVVEGGAVLDMALAGDGDTLVAVSSHPRPYASVVRVRDAMELRRIPHEEVIRAVAISADGRRIATAGNGPGIALFDADTGKHIRDLPGHRGGVSSLAFSPASDRLLSGGFRGSALLWELDQSSSGAR